MGEWAGISSSAQTFQYQTGALQAVYSIATNLGYNNGWFYETRGSPATQGADPSGCPASSGDKIDAQTWQDNLGHLYYTVTDLSRSSCYLVSVQYTNGVQQTYAQGITEVPTICVNGNCGATQWPKFNDGNGCDSQGYCNKFFTSAQLNYYSSGNYHWQGFAANYDPTQESQATTTTSCPGGVQTNATPETIWGSYNSYYDQAWLTSAYC